MSSTQRVLIYGGRGGLGSVLVKHFKANSFWVCSIDLVANDEADENILVDPKQEWQQQQDHVTSEVKRLFKGGEEKLNAVLNVAGGWAGGNAKSADLIKNSDLMWKQSVWSSVISASLASQYLKEGGCLVLPGAKPALGGTPGMIGYGMAKAAVHQLVKSMAGADSGLPSGATALALLPITLDTAMNRKFMPDADKSTWTKLEFVAELLHGWTTSSAKARPKSGSLVQLVTKNNETKLVTSE